jgi:hypothetical protein
MTVDPDSAALRARLKELSDRRMNSLSEKHRNFLLAVIGAVCRITDAKNGNAERDLQAEFEAAFEALSADQVAGLLAYANGAPPMIVHHEDII